MCLIIMLLKRYGTVSYVAIKEIKDKIMLKTILKNFEEIAKSSNKEP